VMELVDYMETVYAATEFGEAEGLRVLSPVVNEALRVQLALMQFILPALADPVTHTRIKTAIKRNRRLVLGHHCLTSVRRAQDRPHSEATTPLTPAEEMSIAALAAFAEGKQSPGGGAGQHCEFCRAPLPSSPASRHSLDLLCPARHLTPLCARTFLPIKFSSTAAMLDQQSDLRLVRCVNCDVIAYSLVGLIPVRFGFACAVPNCPPIDVCTLCGGIMGSVAL